MTTSCCAECGGEEGVGVIRLKACKSCMIVKYCNVNCQKNHWPKHKKECKLRSAEICDEALFQDPLAKEDCPICFIPMPVKLIACMTLSPATITSGVPVYDFAEANEELANMGTETYYSCCGKSICGGCVDSFCKSGNNWTCPFCKSDRMGKTYGERVGELMKRVEVNDAGSMMVLGNNYYHGDLGLQQDLEKAMELWTQAAELGCSKAYYQLGCIMMLRGIQRKRSSIWGPPLWQGMKPQDTTLDAWRHSPEMWSEL